MIDGDDVHPERRGENAASNDAAGADRRVAQEQAFTHDRRSRQRRTLVGWSMLVAGGLILVIGAWVGWRSYQAYSHLKNASAKVGILQDQLQDISTASMSATTTTVDDLQSEAGAARSAVDDPLYRAATALPFLGANLAAIREVTLTIDSLAATVMPSLVDVAQTLQPAQLAPIGGAINLEPIQRISPQLQSADAAVNQARERISAIDRTAVVQPVGDAVVTLLRKLDQAEEVTGTGARVARLVPPMLGSEGPRTYLVAFQNLAEHRATGGIFGSYAVITADKGKISVVNGAPSRTLGVFDSPVAQLGSDEIKLYSDRPAQFPADVNLGPDFPTAAPLFAEMYRQRTGTTVDGVVAIDPVALSYLLKGSSPIDVGEGVAITSDNLASIMLSTAYAKFSDPDQNQRDTFLADATTRLFSEVMSGNVDASAILTGLQKAADERRVLIYSADPAEQADLATTGVSGAIDTELGPQSIGVFLNDGHGDKLGYYLSSEAHVTAGDCQPDGRRELSVRVVLRSSAPANGLPAYVAGSTPTDAGYVLRTNILLFAPLGGAVVAAERDGVPIGIARGVDRSREVGTTTVELPPGASSELTVTVLAPAAADGSAGDIQPQLVLTPGVSPWVTSVDSYPGCLAPTD